MKPFDVYPLYSVTPERAKGSWLWDENGTRYLDLYGGHAVISIGHSHPHYVHAIKNQVEKLGFYSNAVLNPLQDQLAALLGELSGYPDYQLFMINSGAEAIENALKVASFATGRQKIIMLERAFHGRTAGAVAITDNPKIQAAINPIDHVIKIPFGDLDALENALSLKEACAFIVEGIQGVGGIYSPEAEYLQAAKSLCDRTGTVMILDEIQSGYGRTGAFFAHQHAGIKADIITIAKGMGNGFPVGGVLIGPQFTPWHGMLGTTFGGNHLACAAGIAVLEVLRDERLMLHAGYLGNYLIRRLKEIPAITDVRGRGLMIGFSLPYSSADVRKRLLMEHHIFTGSASDPNTVRLLPPLSVTKGQIDLFFEALIQVLQTTPQPA